MTWYSGTLHKKSFFQSPEMSGNAQKGQVNIIFPSTFWLKKTVFPISQRFKSRTFH